MGREARLTKLRRCSELCLETNFSYPAHCGEFREGTGGS
jgi:hypothetical protein